MNLIELEAKAGEAKANITATISHIKTKAPNHWAVRNLEKVEDHLYYQHEMIVKMAKEVQKLKAEIDELVQWD